MQFDAWIEFLAFPRLIPSLMCFLPERVSPEHPLSALGLAGLGQLLGFFCKERVEDGCGGLLDYGERLGE